MLKELRDDVGADDDDVRPVQVVCLVKKPSVAQFGVDRTEIVGRGAEELRIQHFLVLVTHAGRRPPGVYEVFSGDHLDIGALLFEPLGVLEREGLSHPLLSRQAAV